MNCSVRTRCVWPVEVRDVFSEHILPPVCPCVQRFDADRDGVLSACELQRLLAALELQVGAFARTHACMHALLELPACGVAWRGMMWRDVHSCAWVHSCGCVHV